MPKYLNLGIKIGLSMVALTYFLPLLLTSFNLQNSKIDPTKRFNSWSSLVANIQIERLKMLPSPEHTFVLAIGHRNLASELAFYLPDHPKVYRYELGREIKTQYEVWPGPLEFKGNDALVVSDVKDPTEEIQMAFRQLNFVTQIENPMQPGRFLYLFLGKQLLTWPNIVGQAQILE